MKKRVLIPAISYVLAIALIFSASIFTVASADSDSFKTQNDNHLKLRVDLETDYKSGNDFITVTAKVYLEHYSVFVRARDNGAISINGDSKAFSTPAINQADNTKKSSLLTTHTVQVPYKPGETINADIYAKWYANGVFSGKKIDWLEASGKLAFNGSNASVTPGGGTDNDINDTSVAGENKTEPNENADANENENENENAMGGAVISQQDTIKSDTGTLLNLRAVWNASDSLTEDGKVTYTVQLYLDYNSLQMRTRSGGKLTVGDKIIEFNIPAIQEPANTKHSVQLAAAAYEADIGENVNISANMPYNGTYNSKTIGDITLSSTVSVE